MPPTERRNGLTVLAVINFMVGGLAACALLGLGLMMHILRLVKSDPHHQQPHEQQPVDVHVLESEMAGAIGILAVIIVLTVASGVVYLQQKRILGRALGNAFAMISLLSSLGLMMLLPLHVVFAAVLCMV